MSISNQHDVLIIGSGAAGLSLALRLASNGPVALISKGPVNEGCTYYAQGGISAVLAEEDSFQSHVDDTINAGAGLCDPDSVRFTIEHGPENIRWLQQLGVPFTKETSPDGSRVLVNHVRQHASIDVYENHIAVDLITGSKQGLKHNRCVGAYILNKNTGHVKRFLAKTVVLATGGASKVYLYTTNPDCSTGDGIAMAWRAGCRVGNMEFNQFHPTCLYHPEAKSFLISEAVRGEGGKLLLPDGEQFMHRFDQRTELAPRDIVARAIDHEMKRLGAECVYLDISHRSAAFIKSHFPTIFKRCLELGLDITKQPIPVVPAAHYTCGGVMTDMNGRTDIEGLYAIGETAFTRMHGANRMASNSLLECLVFAGSASKDIIKNIADIRLEKKIAPWDESRVTDSDEEVVVTHNWDELRRFMWDYVGIVRTNKRLERAMRRIQLLQHEIYEYYSNFRISSDLIELRNLAQVSELIIRCAMERKESRGLHFSLDYPDSLGEQSAKDTILTPGKDNKPAANIQAVK